MDEREVVKKICVCKKCSSSIVYDKEDVIWDEKGTGYSTKLVKCPTCGHYHVIGYIEDEALYVNEDERYYF